jgi:hypothetical protein
MKKCLNLSHSIVGALILVPLLFVLIAVAQAADLSVETAAICRDIVDRAPVDQGTSFSVSVGKLYCFTKIVGAETPTEVTHVWYFGAEERARITLSIGGSSWRTYSSKVLQQHEIGAWRVEVLDADGNILETANFTVTQ